MSSMRMNQSGDAAVRIGGQELMLEYSYRDHLAIHTPHTSMLSRSELLISLRDACTTQIF